jgi:hypothetical protein
MAVIQGGSLVRKCNLGGNDIEYTQINAWQTIISFGFFSYYLADKLAINAIQMETLHTSLYKTDVTRGYILRLIDN